MPERVLVDTSCLIVLQNIGELDLLKKLYDTVTITPEVAQEFGEPLPTWVKILSSKNTLNKEIFEQYIDKGEASILTLALELPGAVAIVDDSKARTIAVDHGIRISGTLGVLVKAKQKGIIIRIKPIVKKLQSNGFWISPELVRNILAESEEE